jgi:hypothetical protein
MSLKQRQTEQGKRDGHGEKQKSFEKRSTRTSRIFLERNGREIGP